MNITLVIVFALSLTPSINAKSTELALESKTYGYFSKTNTHESLLFLIFLKPLDKDIKRTVVQEPEDQYSECSTPRQDVYNETSGTWILDDSVLESSAVDVQCIVTCANPSETITPSVSELLKPSGTITINTPPTITRFQERVFTSEETCAAAENETAKSCLERSDECLFNTKYKSQLVAMNPASLSTCGTMKTINMKFKNNQSNGRATLVNLGSTSIARDVRIEANKRTDDRIKKAFLVFATSGIPRSNLTSAGLVINGNQIQILKANSSLIKMSNSGFTNTFKLGSIAFYPGSELNIQGNHFTSTNWTSTGGVMHLESLKATLTRRVFNLSARRGALNLLSQDREVPEAVRLEDSHFEENNASVFVGSIHFYRPPNQTKRNTDWRPRSHVVFSNTSFSNNIADGGVAVYSLKYNRVSFRCSEFTDSSNSLGLINTTRASSLQANQQRLFPHWISSKKGTKKSSSLISPYVRNCKIREVKGYNLSEIITGPNSIQINETVPGERLPDILIECYDEYGDLAKASDSGLTASLRSNIGGDLGEILAINLNDGAWKIKGVTNPSNEAFNRSYTYELEITFGLDYVKPINVLINVRDCKINEEKQDEGVQCKKCDATQYNFNPMDGNCKHCDDTLDCSGIYVFPKANYWHSSPCHVPAQKCLTAKACKESKNLRQRINGPEFGSISSALKSLSCDFSNTFIEKYYKLQCNEGYEGVLCGSCVKNHGRSLSFECTKCNGPVVGVLILVSVCVWLAAIAAITIHGSKTVEESLSVISKPLHDIASRRCSTYEESIPEETEVEKQEEKMQEDEDTEVIPCGSKALKCSLTGVSRSTDASYWVGYNLPTTTVTTTVETPEEINNLKLAQLAKWKLCEVFKITMNFLQAISVAAAINVEWTRYILTMFDLSAFAGGASTALVTRAIHCFPWWNGTKHATYVSLVSGLLLPTFVILSIVTFFALLTYKESKGMYYFIKRSLLATLAICYFSYLSMTRVAVMPLYCIGVRADNNFSSEDKTYYWAFDTSIECADQEHIRMMVFGGILLALFSVGFPLISSFTLVLCQKSSGSREPQWMTDILGFLYRAYKRDFVYWESIVMLRKALLSEIAVFTYHLGGHSQGVLACCILSVCLLVQAINRPYRVEFDTINNIESLSLFVSGITFNIAQFFAKDRTNGIVRVALAGFLMALIIGFLVYLIVCLLLCFIDVLKTDLIVTGAPADKYESSWCIVRTWAASKLETWVASILQFIERPGGGDAEALGDMELGSNKSENSADDMSDTST